MAACKGILLFSGGLDSLLTAKILMELGVEVIGFHCVLPFAPPDSDPRELKSSMLAEEIGLPLVYYRCGDEYLEIIKNPPHGYGQHMNPCIDCKIHFIKKAGELMVRENADFVATGEVIGQRPMSQMKHTLNHIEKETGLKGRLLRPLSAKLLKPTLAEEKGLIDRTRLYDINGRSRKRQMDLVKQFGIDKFASPAGGCHFTDLNLSLRVKDLIDNFNNYEQVDFYLITIGRHIRISARAKIIVAKNEGENILIEKYMNKSDYFFIPEFRGPSVFAKGEVDEKDFILIARILSRYGKPGDNDRQINVYKNSMKIGSIQAEDPIPVNELEPMRI